MTVLVVPAFTLAGVWIGHLIASGLRDRRLMRLWLAVQPGPIANHAPPTVAELDPPTWSAR